MSIVMPAAYKIQPRPGVLAYVACFVLWLVIVVMSVATLFVVRETVVPLLSLLVGPTQWTQFIILIGTLLSGMVLVVVALGAEPYLRHGLERGQLMRNFAQLAVPLVMACCAGLLIQWLAIAVL